MFKKPFNPIPRGGKRMLGCKPGTLVPTYNKIRIHKFILRVQIPNYSIKSNTLILQTCCKEQILNLPLLTQE